MREITFHGKMPDPFLKADGTRMTPEEWAANRDQIRDMIVDIEYGGMPPRPEYLRIEPLTGYRRGHVGTWYKIYAGTKEKQISFTLELSVPMVVAPEKEYEPWTEAEVFPVILTGDGCYENMESDVMAEAHKHGFIAAKFNRLEMANDCYNSRVGGLYDIYEGDFTAISAWAWGYLTCMDVFEQLPFVDESNVAITGHSRGGKTVMLAAVMDERIKYVCPNNSGCHGAVSHRCEVPMQETYPRRTETLSDMLKSPHMDGTEAEGIRALC